MSLYPSRKATRPSGVFARRQHFFAWILFVAIVCSTWTCRCNNSSDRTHHRAPNVFVCAMEEAREEDMDKARTRTRKRADGKRQFNQILAKAGRRGLGGGITGAIAGVVQVLSLMWLRTIINYQSRYGTTFSQALSTLLKDGGIGRLYRGVGFALIQAPLARFGSTAANDGVQALLANLDLTKDWGPGRTTIVASFVVGLWRIFLMPIDTMKTVLQVDSYEGFRSLMRRLKAGKISVLYQGLVANALSSMLSHYPWFFTYNWLSSKEWLIYILPSKLLQNAFIGLVASVVSDVSVNAVRVVKTTKQSLGSRQSVTYAEVIRIVIAADGWRGLFGRSLGTRLLTNALQSIVFTVIWRGLAERFRSKSEREGEARTAQ